MNPTEEIKKIEKGCERNTQFFHGLGEEKEYWKCGERAYKSPFLCSTCEAKLTILKKWEQREKDILKMIDEWFNSLRMGAKESDRLNYRVIGVKDREELKQKIKGEGRC